MSKAHLFDPDALEVLVSIADTRSFTETGKLLKRSQSTISASIRRLEETAGCKLVNRTTRTVLLTRDGEEMVRYARAVNELSEKAARRFSQPDCAETVRLGVFTNFEGMVLARTLHAFGQLHGSVQVKIEVNRSDILLSRFRDGALDVVLATRQQGHGLGPPLWQDELVWVGAREIPKNIREPIPLAVRVKPSMLRRMGIEALNVARRPHVVTFEGNSYPSIAAAVSAGLGISIFPQSIRPPSIPIVTSTGLPRIGSIDFVLLKAEEDRRAAVQSLYDILQEQSPRLFTEAAASIFGGVAFPAEIDGVPVIVNPPAWP